MPQDEFEAIVSDYYERLYRFAYSLTRSEADACDLTQQTFYIWATKGHQLRDRSKTKSWLFTILHREFLHGRRREVRFPHLELSDEHEELPTIAPEVVNKLDAARVVECLGSVQEPYRAALNLFTWRIIPIRRSPTSSRFHWAPFVPVSPAPGAVTESDPHGRLLETSAGKGRTGKEDAQNAEVQ